MQADMMTTTHERPGTTAVGPARPSWWRAPRLRMIAAGMVALAALIALAGFETWFTIVNAAPTLMTGRGRVEAAPPRSELEFHRRVESGYYGKGTAGLASYPGATAARPRRAADA